MSEEYKVDYDELRKVYRMESKSPNLSKLDSDFYKALKKFIKEEKKEYAKKDSFNSSSFKKYNNIIKLVEKIKDLRLKKCMNMCLVYSRTCEFKGEENLIDFEIDFVKNITKAIDKATENTKNILGIKDNDVCDTEDKDLINVKFIEDIPSFIGSDMKEYGPFNKGDVKKIPDSICDMLLSKKLVEKVSD